MEKHLLLLLFLAVCILAHHDHDHDLIHKHDHEHEHHHELSPNHEHQHDHEHQHKHDHQHQHHDHDHDHQHDHEHQQDHHHQHHDHEHQHQHQHSHEHEHDHGHSHIDREYKGEKWSRDDLFLYGMLSGGFVSLIGFIAAFLLLFCQKFIPKAIYTAIIQLLFSFSCGALLGQTMLHIVPEAYASPLLNDQQVSLTFISAIIAFILLERVMQKFGISDHEHWHEDDEEKEESSKVVEKRELEAAKGKEVKNMKHSTGYLNLISSLLHNFIDGLAIGIAFNLGNPRQFIPITVGIIAHEIPREMGDVAILLKSKFNAKETILSNGIVNMISLVGVYLGLNSHGLPPLVKQYMLVFVAGNFLYIASDIWKNLFYHKSFWLNLLEMMGLVGGVLMTLDHQHSH